MKLKLFFLNVFNKFPFIGACLAQMISLILIKLIIQFFNLNLSLISFALLQATFSVTITQLIFKLPRWFFYISAFLPILFIFGFNFIHISNWIYGALFLFFAFTFTHTLKERVPLYLTNKKTHDALKKIAADNNAKSFLDLGSGLGGVVRALSVENIASVGVETAPLLWGLSAFLSFVTFKGKIVRRNIWSTTFGDYDIVYAFLSPAIMEKLYKKVKTEMKNNSLFISNSFEVMGVPADEVWQLTDERQTQLFFYRIKKES